MSSAAPSMITKCLTYILVKTVNALVRNLKLNFSTEDFKMKKLLLNLLVSLSRDFAALQVSHTLSFSVTVLGLNITFLTP